MSLYAPQTKEETKTLHKLLNSLDFIQTVKQRQANPEFIAAETELRLKMRDIFNDAEKHEQHCTNKVNWYTKSGVYSAMEALADKFEIPVFMIHTMPRQEDYSDEVHLRIYGWNKNTA